MFFLSKFWNQHGWTIIILGSLLTFLCLCIFFSFLHHSFPIHTHPSVRQPSTIFPFDRFASTSYINPNPLHQRYHHHLHSLQHQPTDDTQFNQNFNQEDVSQDIRPSVVNNQKTNQKTISIKNNFINEKENKDREKLTYNVRDKESTTTTLEKKVRFADEVEEELTYVGVESEDGSSDFVYEGGASKGENLCRKAIQEITGKTFSKIKPAFLLNPVTKNFLEIDAYNENLKIGVEYNGQQHYKYIPYFHKSKQDFQLQLYRDYIKKSLCEQENVLLIIVPHTLKPDEIKPFIQKELTKHGRSTFV